MYDSMIDSLLKAQAMTLSMSMSMIQMIIIIMISRVILQRDNVRHAHTVKIWHTKKSNSQLFSIRFWFNQSIPVTVKHLLIIISPRPTWMIVFSTTCWKEQGMTLLMSMIQMIIIIMIRRVILQRFNVRMNCIRCSLKTSFRWKCKTLNQRSTIVLCLGGNQHLVYAWI